ncbi:HAD-IIIC family phosphatase [Dactylosporangium sp. NPDC050688]|uniref:HAD-IIIC family phosphatase n=1 Tax=Dactylosporangium sp. NPDC050688 TaxID=3157217 RepID=UPI0034073E02
MPAEPADRVKCVVWDLDDTLWLGTLSEGSAGPLRPQVRHILTTLDQRGVLHSIASKNDPDRAIARLRQLGVEEFFLHPQISWLPKSELVRAVATELNIGLDTLLFIDDSPFERAEVAHAHPQVRCVDAAALDDLLTRPELDAVVTPEAGRRRELYRQAEVRRRYEDDFRGPRSDFLASLGLRLTIAPAVPEDLLRAAELTERTHQLNTTGLVFSAADLAAVLPDPGQTLLVIGLEDRFGSYGTVGLVLLARDRDEWRIRLLLMSCRVMGRNVGGVVLAWLAQQCDAAGVQLTADFLPNEVNRPMYVVYRLAGFADDGDDSADGGVRRLRLGAGASRAVPQYVHLVAADVLPARAG